MCFMHMLSRGCNDPVAAVFFRQSVKGKGQQKSEFLELLLSSMRLRATIPSEVVSGADRARARGWFCTGSVDVKYAAPRMATTLARSVARNKTNSSPASDMAAKLSLCTHGSPRVTQHIGSSFLGNRRSFRAQLDKYPAPFSSSK